MRSALFSYLRKASFLLAISVMLLFVSCAAAPTTTITPTFTPTPTVVITPTVTSTPTPSLPHVSTFTIEQLLFDGEYTQEKMDELVRSIIIATGIVDNSPFYLSYLQNVSFTDDGKFMLFLDKHGQEYKNESGYTVPVEDVRDFLYFSHIQQVGFSERIYEKNNFNPEKVTFAQYDSENDTLFLSALPKTNIQVSGAQFEYSSTIKKPIERLLYIKGGTMTDVNGNEHFLDGVILLDFCTMPDLYRENDDYTGLFWIDGIKWGPKA